MKKIKNEEIYGLKIWALWPKLVYLFIFFVLFISCKGEQKPTEAEATPATNQYITTVSTAEATEEDFMLHTLSNGHIVANHQSKLSFKASGIIEKVFVANGSVVREGLLLARLEASAQEVAVQQAQVQLKEARLELNKLLIEYGGEDQDSNSVKPRIWEAVKTRSGYYRALANLASAKLQLQNTELKAPYMAIVANLKTKSYNPISASEIFCTLLSRAALWVEFSVLETELSAVQLGQIAQITPIAYPDKKYTAQVAEINPFVNEQGLVLVKAKIQNPDNQLFEGMNAHVRLERRLARQVVIPKEAVVERSGRKVVFVYEKADSTGLAKWHYVTVGHENENQVTVAEGVKAGEKVIVQGNLNLGHDAKVKE